jgi:LuxR family transcriptional regulator, regulator of acetate metabolism
VSTRVTRGEQPGSAVLRRSLIELLALEREVVELAYVRRSDALERVRDAVRRLGEIGSPQGILERAAEELTKSSQLDRVLISDFADGRLEPRAIHPADEQAAAALEALRENPIRLEYPLIEADVVTRQRAELVDVRAARTRAAARLVEVMRWESYVVAPLAVQGKTVGLVHGDAAASSRPLDPLDVEVIALFSEGFGGVFERAVLRETLQLHHRELQSAVKWMSGRLGQLAADGSDFGSQAGAGDPALAETLTARELEVLRLLARGQTNLAIANALVVREGTVKYHVKNILRKLGATSRADAVSRYVRATGSGAIS